MVRVTLLFKGGAELLFDGVKERRVDVPSSVVCFFLFCLFLS